MFWCHNCSSSPPVNNRVPSKFHDSELILDSVCKLPVWTHRYSNCYTYCLKELVQKMTIHVQIIVINYKYKEKRNTNMRACAMNQWRRLENTDLIFIRSGNFSCIGTAIQAADSYIVMYSSRNYLNSFKIAGKNYYIAACCVRLYRTIHIL